MREKTVCDIPDKGGWPESNHKKATDKTRDILQNDGESSKAPNLLSQGKNVLLFQTERDLTTKFKCDPELFPIKNIIGKIGKIWMGSKT